MSKQSERGTDCRGRQRHAAASPQAAAQNQVPVPFANVPADVWQDLDRSIRSMVADGCKARRIVQALGLQRLYGIRARALDRYIQQRCAAGSLPVVGSVHRASSPRAGRMSFTQRLVDTAAVTRNPWDSRNACFSISASPAAVDARPRHDALTLNYSGLNSLQAEAFAQLHQRLLDADLTTEQLCKVAGAIAHQRSALNRAQAQHNANRRDCEQRLKLKKEKAKANKPRKSMAQHMHDVFGVVPRFNEKKYEDYINSVDALGRPL